MHLHLELPKRHKISSSNSELMVIPAFKTISTTSSSQEVNDAGAGCISSSAWWLGYWVEESESGCFEVKVCIDALGGGVIYESDEDFEWGRMILSSQSVINHHKLSESRVNVELLSLGAGTKGGWADPPLGLPIFSGVMTGLGSGFVG